MKNSLKAWFRRIGKNNGPGSSEYGQLASYFCAIVLLVGAVGLRALLDPWLGDSLSHPTVFTAVLAATWYFGVGPAIVAALLGYFLVDFFIIDGITGSFSYRVASIGLYGLLNTIIIVLVKSFRDERNRLQRERARRALLSKAVEAAANSILVTDRLGNIIWVNRAFTALTGYQDHEVIGKSPRILKSGEHSPQFYREMWDVITSGSLWQGQLVNRRKDGTTYHEELTITPICEQSGEITHFVGIMENVTQRKLTEEMLHAARISAERAKGAAEEANRAKDHFLAVLSHELRTPLTPVLAAVQLMQRKPGLDGPTREQLEIISRNVQLEARLIDDLLDLTRIVRGKLVLDRKPMMLCTAVQRAVEICRPDLDARRLKFSLDMKDAPYVVDGDLARLQQVIWNLLNNAIKFTPDGGFIELRCRREDGHVALEVADTGIGLDAPSALRIFNAFEQGEGQITRRFGGLGLGLAISKRLVEMHSGTISVQSPGKDQGTTFRVVFPLANAEIERPSTAAAELSPAASKRILLVEDHGDTATMIKMLLESYGYIVRPAGDVQQALEAIEKEQFDLLISDLGLPDKSGLELIQDLRTKGNTLKAIALSGYGREEDVARSQDAGFNAHLTKPVDADALATAVARMF